LEKLRIKILSTHNLLCHKCATSWPVADNSDP